MNNNINSLVAVVSEEEENIKKRKLDEEYSPTSRKISRLESNNINNGQNEEEVEDEKKEEKLENCIADVPECEKNDEDNYFTKFDDEVIKKMNENNEPQKRRYGVLFTDVTSAMASALPAIENDKSWVLTNSEVCTCLFLFRMAINNSTNQIQELIVSIPVETNSQIDYNFQDMTESSPDARLLCEKVFVIRNNSIDFWDCDVNNAEDEKIKERTVFINNASNLPTELLENDLLVKLIKLAFLCENTNEAEVE